MIFSKKISYTNHVVIFSLVIIVYNTFNSFLFEDDLYFLPNFLENEIIDQSVYLTIIVLFFSLNLILTLVSKGKDLNSYTKFIIYFTKVFFVFNVYYLFSTSPVSVIDESNRFNLILYTDYLIRILLLIFSISMIKKPILKILQILFNLLIQYNRSFYFFRFIR